MVSLAFEPGSSSASTATFEARTRAQRAMRPYLVRFFSIGAIERGERGDDQNFLGDQARHVKGRLADAITGALVIRKPGGLKSPCRRSRQ